MKEDNDWQDIMMGPALIQNYNLTVRGGTKYFTYYTGLQIINQDGTIKGTNFERFNAQFKSEYKRGFFTFGNNVVFSAYKDNPLYGYARGGYIGIILQSIPSLQKFDPENDKGGYGKVYGDAKISLTRWEFSMKTLPNVNPIPTMPISTFMQS